MADHTLLVLYPSGHVEDLPRYLDQSIRRLLQIPHFELGHYAVQGPGGLAWRSNDFTPLPDMSELAGGARDHDFVIRHASFIALHDFYKSRQYSGSTWEQEARGFERDIYETVAPLWRREMAPGGSHMEFSFALPESFDDDCVYLVSGDSRSPPETPPQRRAIRYIEPRSIWLTFSNLRVHCQIEARAPLILQVPTPPDPFDTTLTLRTLAGSPIVLDLAPRKAFTVTPRLLYEAAQRVRLHPPLYNVALVAPWGDHLRCDDDEPLFAQWARLRSQLGPRRPAVSSKARVGRFPGRRRARASPSRERSLSADFFPST